MYERYEYEERRWHVSCSVCRRQTHETQKRLEELGWQLDRDGERCPAHNDFAMELAADINAVMQRHAANVAAAVRVHKQAVSDIPAGLLESATIWRQPRAVNL